MISLILPSLLLSVSILLPGAFRGGDVPEGAAGDWLALIFFDGESALRAVEVSVVPVRDAVVDSAGEATGREIRIDPAVDAAVLIRGLSGLREGNITTVLSKREIDGATQVEARLGNGSYSFLLDCQEARQGAAQQLQRDCGLIVKSADEQSELARYTMYKEGGVFQWAAESPPVIVWGGDLDGDRQLDVLLQTSDHYNVEEITLFLSSLAGNQELLVEAASFKAVGC